MDIFRISSQHRIDKRYWTFCGDDYGYNLFKDKKPKEVAIDVINTVLNGQNIDNMQFAYKPYYKYIGSVFVWDKEEVREIMQDIVNFTKQSDNNIRWR